MVLKKPGPTFACTAWKNRGTLAGAPPGVRGGGGGGGNPGGAILGWADVGGPVLNRKGPELRPDWTERQRGRLTDGLNTRKRAQTLAKCLGQSRHAGRIWKANPGEIEPERHRSPRIVARFDARQLPETLDEQRRCREERRA